MADKIGTLLNHARRSVPYYQTILPLPAEPLPGDLYDYLESLPLLSRQIIQKEKARLISIVGDTSTWLKAQTSGTNGEPLEIILNSESHAVEAVLLALHIEACLGSTSWRAGKVFHLTLHPGSRSQTRPALWHKTGQTIKWNLISIWQQADEEFILALADINGAVVTIMPSVVELLCSRIQAAGARGKIQPSLVLLSGETILQETRALVTKILGCPVSSLYTMAEVGIAGSESPDQESYFVEPESAIVEIVDNRGKRLSPGIEGQIVVTALNNLAMPLIRYQTGDRGYWIEANRFRLVETRQPIYLVTPAGSSVNVVRFAKILASLRLDSYHFNQEADGTVTFSYSAADRALDEASHSLIKTVVRGALGPETRIKIRRIDIVTLPEGQQSRRHLPQSSSARPEPLGPDLNEVATWLRKQLIDEPQIEAALLTGSALEPKMMTRFSDIDCVILVRDNPTDAPWLDLARHLKSRVPKLSTNIDCLDSFSQRTPLMTCRMLCEQLPLIGTIDENNLSWPSLEQLQRQGLHWSQDALATLWLRLVDSNQADFDIVREAWLAAKFILDALRYYYLIRGERETASSYILSKVRSDPDIPELWKSTLLEILQVSREYKPPPLSGSNVVERYLQLALSYVRLVQRYLLS